MGSPRGLVLGVVLVACLAAALGTAVPTAICYGLVIYLVSFSLTFGVLLVGFLTSLCLASSRAHGRLRGVHGAIAGTLMGVAGIAAAVAFGYLMFRLLGRGPFGLMPFLASTVPLTVPVLKDLTKASQLSSVESTGTWRVQRILAPSIACARYTVVGYILGLILAVLWFFLVHEKAA